MSSRDEQLEEQYSPSRWSQRFQDPDQVIQHHVEFTARASNEAKAAVPVKLDVQYGPTEGQKFDLYGFENTKSDAPVLVYVHGGYWQELSRCTSAYCVQPLYRAETRVAVVGYDLAPSVTVSEIIEEIKTAVRKILEMASNLGTSRVWLSGHSAGAQLVIMLLFSGWLTSLPEYLQKLVKGFLLISGVYDLTPLVFTYVNDALKLNSDDAKIISPLLLPDPPQNNLHILVAVGEHDSPEFRKQSQQFAEKLVRSCRVVEFKEIPGVDHFDIVENLEDENFVFTKIIIRLITKVRGDTNWGAATK